MATIESHPISSTTELLAQSVKIFLEIKHAFDECDADIQQVVMEMVAIYRDENATPDEKRRAMNTIVEALFTSDGVDVLRHCEAVRKSPAAQAYAKKLDEEEAVFSQRVTERMKDLGMTQDELAVATAVSQPAISNMLNRNCRPQRRTVARIADALGVRPEELWPNFTP